MSKNFSFLKVLIPISVLLGFLQNYIITEVYKTRIVFYSTICIYLFHIITTVVIIIVLLIVNKKEPLKTGFTFMGLSLLKMMVIIIILIPLIKSNLEDKTFDVLTFFIPYFFFLFFEAFFAIRLINQK